MKWNSLVPKVLVENMGTSLSFYLEGLGFSVAFSRKDPLFVYLSLDDTQIMLEETGVRPHTDGIDMKLKVIDVAAVRERLLKMNYPINRDIGDYTYETSEGFITQRELWVNDPDGVLLRIVQEI